MTNFFENIATNDNLAGLSAMLTFFFIIAAAIMSYMSFLQIKYSVANGVMTSRQKADICLNVGMCIVFWNASYQRALATYSFAYQEWAVSHATAMSAPIYLPLTVFGMVLFLWWGCYEIFEKSRLAWWVAAISAGIALCISVILVF